MCNILSFRNINWRGFCGLIDHYQTVGVDPALVVTFEQIPEPIRTEFTKEIALISRCLEQTGEANKNATIRYCSNGYEFHWYVQASVVTVFRNLPDGTNQRVFLKTANKEINAIG